MIYTIYALHRENALGLGHFP